MTFRLAGAAASVVAVTFAVVALSIWWRFDKDIEAASARSAQASTLIATRCGPIEVQQAGSAGPLLVVHGSGGGHDQGMAFAGALAQHGIQVIAMSHFGYLPSALQMAHRYPERFSALILLAPLAYKPPTQADSAPPMPAWAEATMMRVIGSDVLFWAALHVAREQVIKLVLATPPELLTAAGRQERARVNAMLDNILPVSARTDGFRSDTAVGKHLSPAPLESIHVPTLIVSARDDRYGTYASAQYTASRITGAKFVGFDQGGHTWVGHDDEVMAEIALLLVPVGRP